MKTGQLPFDVDLPVTYYYANKAAHQHKNTEKDKNAQKNSLKYYKCATATGAINVCITSLHASFMPFYYTDFAPYLLHRNKQASSL